MSSTPVRSHLLKCVVGETIAQFGSGGEQQLVCYNQNHVSILSVRKLVDILFDWRGV